jgi:hypothetical protein
MEDRRGSLSLVVADFSTQKPYLSVNTPDTVCMHTDESLPTSSFPLAREALTNPLNLEMPLLFGGTLDKRQGTATHKDTTEDEEELWTAQPPLHSFFTINPNRAAASVSPEEEDVLTQRRWRADTAEVESFLTQLDLAREECAAAGLYTKAQACMHRMELTVHLFARRLHAETDAVARRTKDRLSEQHTRERLDLRKRCRDGIAAYKRDAAILRAATEQHFYAQLEKKDVAMQAELRRGCNNTGGEGAEVALGSGGCSSVPTWSKEVQHLRTELQQFIRQRRYGDAERVRVQLGRLEKQEITDHQRCVTQRHVQRLQALKDAQASELAEREAEQRHEIQEMIEAGRVALGELTQRHLAALQALEDRRLHLHAKTREVLRTYAHADVLDPKATGLKLIRLSQLLWTPLVKPRR